MILLSISTGTLEVQAWTTMRSMGQVLTISEVTSGGYLLCRSSLKQGKKLIQRTGGAKPKRPLVPSVRTLVICSTRTPTSAAHPCRTRSPTNVCLHPRRLSAAFSSIHRGLHQAQICAQRALNPIFPAERSSLDRQHSPLPSSPTPRRNGRDREGHHPAQSHTGVTMYSRSTRNPTRCARHLR